MYIDWEKIARIGGRFFLLFLEYCVKLTALAVTAVVLVTEGTFGMKLGTGFGSVSSTLRNIFGAPSDIIDTAYIIHDYNTLTASAFNERYGAQGIDSALAYINGALVYLQDIYYNFASQPFATFFAALIALSSLYLISLVLRFARQKGQGSYLNRLERKLGERVFRTSKELNQPQPVPKVQSNSPQPKSESKEVNKTNRPFGKSQKTNKYLQDYMRSVQNG